MYKSGLGFECDRFCCSSILFGKKTQYKVVLILLEDILFNLICYLLILLCHLEFKKMQLTLYCHWKYFNLLLYVLVV